MYSHAAYTPRLLQSLLPSSLIPALLARTDIAALLRITLPAPVAPVDSTAASTHTLPSGTPPREQSTPRPGDSPPLVSEPGRPLSMSSFGESDVESDAERVSVSTGSGSASGRSRAGLDGSWVGLDVPSDEQLLHPTAP